MRGGWVKSFSLSFYCITYVKKITILGVKERGDLKNKANLVKLKLQMLTGTVLGKYKFVPTTSLLTNASGERPMVSHHNENTQVCNFALVEI